MHDTLSISTIAVFREGHVAIVPFPLEPSRKELCSLQSAIRNPQSGTGVRYLTPEILASINSLELLARTVVEGFISGLHRSPFTGFSTEFAEYRQYLPGDDLRYLDWKLLGRTDRYYIKKYRADTNSQCHILVDTSASMRYATGPVTKLQYAQFLGSSLAYLINRQQDAVGLIAFDQSVRTHVPAHARTGHMRTIFGRMEQLEPGNETRASTVLHEIAERITRRGIIVVLVMSGLALLDKAGHGPQELFRAIGLSGIADSAQFPLFYLLVGAVLLVVIPMVWRKLREHEGLTSQGHPTVTELEDEEGVGHN